MTGRSVHPEIELLLMFLDQGYDGRSWHGPNVRGALRGLKAEQASWKPSRQRHSAWELVLHLAYWKYLGRRRITGEGRGSFPLKGRNWFVPEDRGEEAWKNTIALLQATHDALRETVASLAPADLDRRLGRWMLREVISGLAAHDLYHTGQIQLIRKLKA